MIYDKFPECSSPCSFMKITTHLTSQFTDKNPDTKLYFSKEVKITSEKVKQSFSSAGKIFPKSYKVMSFFSWIVAEVGGYLGMVLGVSLMDLEIVAKIIISSLNNIDFKKIKIVK